MWLALNYETRLRILALARRRIPFTSAAGCWSRSDKRNEPAETALLKLAEVLTADAGVGRSLRRPELAQRPGAPATSRY